MDAKAIMQKYLGKDVKILHNKDRIVLNYCPDNKCDEFSTLQTQSDYELQQFSVLYLYYVSQHYALCDFRHSAALLVKQLLDQTSKQCSGQTENDRAKCALESLASQHAIVVAYVGYDEKQRNEEKVDLAKELLNIGKPEYGPAMCK
jgi:hypothetical protein